MRDLIFWAAVVLYCAALTFSYYNRASEKVLTTLFLGMAALFGAVLAVTIFSSQESINKAFSVPIVIHADSRVPVEALPFQPLPNFFSILVRDKLTHHPELFDADDSFAMGVYHHALQRAIIFWLQEKYPTSWQTDVFPMTIGEGAGYTFRSRNAASKIYLGPEMSERLRENKFGDVRGPFGGGANFGLALPLKTEIDIVAPHFDKSLGHFSSITLRNKFCTMTIKTNFAMSSVGAGSYRLLFPKMSQIQSQKDFKINAYAMVISVTFNRFLTGNPEMPSYRKWASDVADGLENQFSDRLLWSKTKDWIIFHRIVDDNDTAPLR